MLDISPLSILKKRRVKWAPPHFHMFNINQNDYLFEDSIADWIEYKLKGRYYLARREDSNGKLTNVVGFEDQKELTYFTLACPLTRR
jgi:hypothetical protein